MLDLPILQVNMIVTTYYKNLPHITPNKRYIISKIEDDIIWLRNDYGETKPYKNIFFIEADVFFALSLYITFMRLLNLTNKSLESFDN